MIQLSQSIELENTVVEQFPVIIITDITTNKACHCLLLSSGRPHVSAVAPCARNWGFASEVKAMCFNTTESNTGQKAGARVLI